MIWHLETPRKSDQDDPNRVHPALRAQVVDEVVCDGRVEQLEGHADGEVGHDDRQRRHAVDIQVVGSVCCVVSKRPVPFGSIGPVTSTGEEESGKREDGRRLKHRKKPDRGEANGRVNRVKEANKTTTVYVGALTGPASLAAPPSPPKTTFTFAAFSLPNNPYRGVVPCHQLCVLVYPFALSARGREGLVRWHQGGRAFFPTSSLGLAKKAARKRFRAPVLSSFFREIDRGESGRPQLHT